MPNRRLRATGAVALTVIVLAACGQDPVDDETGPAAPAVEETTTEMATEEPTTADASADGAAGEATAPADAVDVETLLSEPTSYLGVEDLAVAGQVDESLTSQVFTLSATEGAEQRLLVLVRDTGDVQEAEDVVIDGTLQQSFTVTDGEAFLGTDLDEARFGRFEGRVFLEAETVQPAGS